MPLSQHSQTISLYIYMDASTLRLGGVLMQQDASGKHHAVACMSHTLNQAKSNYSVTHQETLAVVWVIIFGISM